MRARAPVAALSAHRVHRVLHAPCLARLADLVRSSATAAITETTFRVALGDCILTRVKCTPPIN